MGTWGPGNFENDLAADHLYELFGPLMSQIEHTVEDDSRMEPDEPDSTLMMCNLEILASVLETIAAKIDHPIANFRYGNMIPDRQTISTWKERYLSVWDGYIDELGPDEEYKQKRRQTISDTFDRVLRFSHDVEAE